MSSVTTAAADPPAPRHLAEAWVNSMHDLGPERGEFTFITGADHNQPPALFQVFIPRFRCSTETPTAEYHPAGLPSEHHRQHLRTVT